MSPHNGVQIISLAFPTLELYYTIGFREPVSEFWRRLPHCNSAGFCCRCNINLPFATVLQMNGNVICYLLPFPFETVTQIGSPFSPSQLTVILSRKGIELCFVLRAPASLQPHLRLQHTQSETPSRDVGWYEWGRKMNGIEAEMLKTSQLFLPVMITPNNFLTILTSRATLRCIFQ